MASDPEDKKKPRRGSGTGGVYQDSRGLWTVVLELPERDGKRRRKVIRRKAKSDALVALRAERAKLDQIGDLPTSSPTMEAWMTLWLTQIARPRIKPRTFTTYRGYINGHIIPAIGKQKLDKLTAAHVRKLHEDMARNGCSSTTRLQAHRILAKALTDAMREGRIGRNVATLVDAPRKAVSTRTALDAEDAKALLAAHVDDAAAFASLCCALLAGLRQGERLGLTRDQIDLDTETITVSWQLQRLTWEHGCGVQKPDKTWPCGRKRGGSCPDRHLPLPDGYEARQVYLGLWLTRPKSRAGWREVPMAGPLVEVMRRYLDAVPLGSDGLVFHRDDGRPIDPKDDSAAWHAALAAADLPSVDLHSARHTCATLLADLGVPEHVRIRILGHSSATVTKGYTHATDREARKAIQSLSSLLLPGAQEAEPLPTLPT